MLVLPSRADAHGIPEEEANSNERRHQEAAQGSGIYKPGLRSHGADVQETNCSHDAAEISAYTAADSKCKGGS